MAGEPGTVRDNVHGSADAVVHCGGKIFVAVAEAPVLRRLLIHNFGELTVTVRETLSGAVTRW